MNRVKFLRSDVYDFLFNFDDFTVSKILGYLEILDELGHKLGPPKSKKITKDIYELRVIGNPSIRIFYSFQNQDIFILSAFVKKTQKIPDKELKKAINRLKGLQ